MQSFGVGGAHVRSTWLRGGGVAQALVTGPLTPAVMPELRAMTLNRPTLAGAQSLVLRLDSALMLTPVEQHTKNQSAGVSSAAGLLPVALVVDGSHLDDFRAHAWTLAQRGIVRGVFLPTELYAAYEWATRMARLHLVRG
jgi:hypothetical protein